MKISKWLFCVCLLVFYSDLYACVCGYPKDSVRESYEYYDAVVVATVKKHVNIPETVLDDGSVVVDLGREDYRLKVKRVYKGQIEDEIMYLGVNGNCNIFLKKWRPYLLYLRKVEGGYTTSKCSRSASLWNLPAYELSILNHLKKE